MTYDLHALVRENKVSALKEAIVNGADINRRDEGGMTPLLLALWNSSLSALWGNEESKDETIECLLNYNPDVTIANSVGITPLHVAVTGGNIKFIKALIEKGANINARDKFDQVTPLLKVLLGSSGHWRDYLDYLHTSRRWHDIEVIKCLLEHGADINAQNEKGLTPLMAALENRLACNETHIALLLRYNPDITIKNKVGRTAVSYMYDRHDLSDSIKGMILSLCLLGDPMMQCLKSDQSDFLKATNLPLELYLDIVDYATSHILDNIVPAIPLQDKLDWLKAYKEETRRKGQASEAEEHALTYETGCRP
jgi:ankyrin repeat protein